MHVFHKWHIIESAIYDKIALDLANKLIEDGEAGVAKSLIQVFDTRKTGQKFHLKICLKCGKIDNAIEKQALKFFNSAKVHYTKNIKAVKMIRGRL